MAEVTHPAIGLTSAAATHTNARANAALAMLMSPRTLDEAHATAMASTGPRTGATRSAACCVVVFTPMMSTPRLPKVTGAWPPLLVAASTVVVPVDGRSQIVDPCIAGCDRLQVERRFD